MTLLDLLQATVARQPEHPALSSKSRAGWADLSYSELWELSGRVASGLIALGINPGDRVAITAESSPRWVIADFGILRAGAVNVGLFPSLPAAQIEPLLCHSGAWLLLAGDPKLLEKALLIRETMPDLQIVCLYDTRATPEGVVSFEGLLQLGDERPADLDSIRAGLTDATLAGLVYTSGTSGEQKGVMLTHGNFVANVEQCRRVLVFQPEDTLLSVLPLNHVFERTASCYLPLSCGSRIAYVESLRRLRENLQEIRPTYMILVPRFLEVLHDALLDRMSKARPLKRWLFFAALAVGRKRLYAVLRQRPIPPHVAGLFSLAQRLVLRKLREAIGLDRTKDLVSGAAALSPEINEFFNALGLEVLEGYGLTEAAPVVACNRPGAITIGTVGPPLPGIELALGEQNEILVRGPNVMQGYYHNQQATAAALDAEGWLHTGDVGEMRGQNLRITDRLKDLLVLTSGKNVAPQPIETKLRGSAYIAQAVVLGDRESYVTALLVPAFDRLRHWAQTQHVALPESPREIIALPEVVELLRAEVRRLTVELADFEKVKDFRLLPAEFTVESGELTPTLKVKRRVVLERYAETIRAMYR